MKQTDKSFSIQRRQFIQGIGSAGALATLGASGKLMAQAGASRPNIVFIMADDLGYADLSCTGSSHILTPNIDRIAAMGVQLRQGYANSSICSPTRTALLTGCYQQRFTIGLEEPLRAGTLPNVGVPNDRPTIASVLRDQGYATHLVGKWHLGEPPAHGPLAHGYDSFLGIVEGAADYFRHRLVSNSQPRGIGLARDNSTIEANGYLTDMFGDEVVKIIDEADDRPFFVSLHFNAPHWPWEGREDVALAHALGDSRHYDGGNIAKYKEMVEAMDDNVRKVIAALERSGRLDNTIIVFTSDNGGERFSQTWPFTGVKGELLEGGIRVPILLSWPDRVAAGWQSEQVMISMDFLPTLLSMAGGDASAAGTFDGINLANHLVSSGPRIDRTLYWRFKANEQAAIREGDWKYLKLGGREYLFDLSMDERERAILNTAHPTKLADLRSKWDVWNAQMIPYTLGGNSDDITENYPDRY
jgi:arylsulfatase A-like enzyme